MQLGNESVFTFLEIFVVLCFMEEPVHRGFVSSLGLVLVRNHTFRCTNTTEINATGCFGYSENEIYVI